MRYNNIRKLDISNGEGFRVSVFTQGCPIKCNGCFNKNLWDFNGGKEWTGETLSILIDLLKPDYIKGLTWLGGEPTVYSSEIKEINTLIKSLYPKKTIWLYSGYNLDYLVEHHKDLLGTIDVLVDGPYIEALQDINLEFRGSSNQNIWDIKKSFETNEWIKG